MHESVKLYNMTDNKYILQQADNQQTYEFTATYYIIMIDFILNTLTTT